DLGLNGDEQRGAFEFLANGVGRFRSVDAPPVLGGVNLCPSEVADLDLKRSFHSRLRSSETRWAIGVVSPFSHCAIAWRRIRSVSASPSNASSPSSAKTVTDVPSGSSASSSTRPFTTFPGAIRIWPIVTNVCGLRGTDSFGGQDARLRRITPSPAAAGARRKLRGERRGSVLGPGGGTRQRGPDG